MLLPLGLLSSNTLCTDNEGNAHLENAAANTYMRNYAIILEIPNIRNPRGILLRAKWHLRTAEASLGAMRKILWVNETMLCQSGTGYCASGCCEMCFRGVSKGCVPWLPLVKIKHQYFGFGNGTAPILSQNFPYMHAHFWNLISIQISQKSFFIYTVFFLFWNHIPPIIEQYRD